MVAAVIIPEVLALKLLDSVDAKTTWPSPLNDTADASKSPVMLKFFAVARDVAEPVSVPTKEVAVTTPVE